MGYTNVLKLMQIMTEKGPGAAKRKRNVPTFMRYASPPKRPSATWLPTSWNVVFDNSASELMMHAPRRPPRF